MRLPGLIKKEWKKITNHSSKINSISMTELKHFLRDCFLFLMDVETVHDLDECKFFLTTECFYLMQRVIAGGGRIVGSFSEVVIENIQIYGWKQQTINKTKYNVVAAIISVRNKGGWNIYDYNVQMLRPVNQDPIEGMWISADDDWKIKSFGEAEKKD